MLRLVRHRLTCTPRPARLWVVAWALSLLLAQRVCALEANPIDKLLLTQPVTTMESVLARLPLALMSHYALVFKSRSLQDASWDHPRVILFGNDAKFVVTFNGQAGQKGFDTLETMAFDEESASFQFREYRFAASGQPQAVSVSGLNPPKCAVCHGTPAHPIWDSFPTWPGAYGERYLAALTEPEQQGLYAFLAIQPHNARYQWLKNIALFTNANTFYPTKKSQYTDNPVEAPNALLSQLLMGLNLRAVARELTQTPNFSRYRYALLSSTHADCGPVRQAFPRSWQAEFGPSLDKFTQQTQWANQVQSANKALRRLAPPAAETAANPSVDSWIELRYIAERGLGLSANRWTLALETNSFDFSAAQPAREMLGQALAEIVGQTDPTVAKLASFLDLDPSQRYCAYLRRASIAALSGGTAGFEYLAHSPSSSPSHQRPFASGSDPIAEAVQRCVSCHQHGDIGPELPLGEPESLAHQLGQGHYPHGTLLAELLHRLSAQAGPDRMPLGENLSEESRLALQQYFRQLAQK